MSEEAPAPAKKSDLGVRTASALVMLAVAGGAMWLGGIWLDGFIAVVGAVTFYEFARLILKISNKVLVRATALMAGAIYIGAATFSLVAVDSERVLLFIIGVVVSIDTGAYFLGRTLGGPKIAPSISPSKTWAGLLGGTIGATIATAAFYIIPSASHGIAIGFSISDILAFVLAGIIFAVLAQSGDFFESWLKRRAGVKDSSNLIPGHGGVFDRVDGMMPIAILFGAILATYFPHWMGR